MIPVARPLMRTIRVASKLWRRDRIQNSTSIRVSSSLVPPLGGIDLKDVDLLVRPPEDAGVLPEGHVRANPLGLDRDADVIRFEKIGQRRRPSGLDDLALGVETPRMVDRDDIAHGVTFDVSPPATHG